MLSLSNPSISFKRLGHFSLDDNVKTNYQARELKTVYVDTHCQYLKLLLHKNHTNHVNIFNQVGMVQLVCNGAYLGDYEVAMLQGGGGQSFQGNFQMDASLMPRNLKVSNSGADNLDPLIQDKIRALESKKQLAVDEENFDQAKRFKEVIDKLLMTGSQLLQLEAQKKMAIENEDFDAAKVLKYEFDKLRSQSMAVDLERVGLTPIRTSRNAGFEDQQSYHPGQEEYQPEGPPQMYTQRTEEMKSEVGRQSRAGETMSQAQYEQQVEPAVQAQRSLLNDD